ncbi:MAG TPA: hypothetical protein VK176_01195 [Phycisphaerales bacterium]|nr:hypothetical protein [Phycisphaerales bacterium]
MSIRQSPIIILALAGLAASSASADLRSAVKVVAVGDLITRGAVVSSINEPTTDRDGTPAVTGNSSLGNFVFYGDAAIWFNSDALPMVLTGAETTMGAGANGQFIYSPSADGGDAAYTHAGLLLRDTDPAPGFPGKFNTFNSRPYMTGNGWAYWCAGVSNTSGGSTATRVQYLVQDPSSPVFQTPIIGGNTYGGLTTTAGGINFGYDISENGQWRIHDLTNTGGSATDRYIVVFGPAGDFAVGQEGFLISDIATEGWTAFRIPGINNNGDYIIAGDTTAPGNDEVLLFNGVVQVREGDVVDGKTLAGSSGTGGVIDAMAINNCGGVAHLWSAGSATADPEYLFYGPGNNLKLGSTLVLATGDQLDFDGDGNCDAIITDFNASQTIAPGIDLADDGMIFVSADLTTCDGTSAFEAIIGVRAYCPSDWDNSGFSDIEDFTTFVIDFEAGDADFDCSGFTDTDDYDAFVRAFEKGC